MKLYDDNNTGFSFQPARPNIIPNHVDGPLLTFSDGQMHWLTPWERILFYFGLTDAYAIQRKRRPRLAKCLREMKWQ